MRDRLLFALALVGAALLGILIAWTSTRLPKFP